MGRAGGNGLVLSLGVDQREYGGAIAMQSEPEEHYESDAEDSGPI